MNDPSECKNAFELMASVIIAHDAFLALHQDQASIEFNLPAEVIMLADILTHTDGFTNIARLTQTVNAAVRNAETGMLQIAFLNKKLNPGCAWLNQAVNAGWRYRIDKGFYLAPSEKPE